MDSRYLDQYRTIYNLIEDDDSVGCFTPEFVDAFRGVITRNTIRKRLNDMVEAGILAVSDEEKPALFYTINDREAWNDFASAHDEELKETWRQSLPHEDRPTADELAVLDVFANRKARDERGWTYRSMATAVGHDVAAALNSLVEKGEVSESAPKRGNARHFKLVSSSAPAEDNEWEKEDAEMRLHILEVMNEDRDRKWFTFGDLNIVCGLGSLDQTEDVLDCMVEAGELVMVSNDDDSVHYDQYRFSYRLAGDTRWQRAKVAPQTLAEAPSAPVEAPVTPDAPEEPVAAPVVAVALPDLLYAIIGRAVADAIVAFRAETDAKIAALTEERDNALIERDAFWQRANALESSLHTIKQALPEFEAL